MRITGKEPTAKGYVQRELRREATPAERWLWERLRARRLSGRKFRRQEPLGPYVVDFYCHEARLVVELDGAHHAGPEQLALDEQRDAFLKAHGMTVLRFWNAQLEREPEQVLATITRALTASSPRPRGEGQG